MSTPPEVHSHIPPSIIFRHIPTVSYTIQNILISLATLIASIASLILTCTVFLPLSLIRACGLIPKRMMEKGEMFGANGVAVDAGGQLMKRGKVVVIVGASRGIGLEVLKQYAREPNTTVIAMSRDAGTLLCLLHTALDRVLMNDCRLGAYFAFADALRESIIDLGDSPADVRMETIDLSGSHKAIETAVEKLDDTYGPISHLYAIAGITNTLNDKKAWSLVRSHPRGCLNQKIEIF